MVFNNVLEEICDELVGCAEQDVAMDVIDRSRYMLCGQLFMFVRRMVNDLIKKYSITLVETTIAQLINADADRYISVARNWALSITPEKLDRRIYYDKDNRALLTACAFELMMKHYEES